MANDDDPSINDGSFAADEDTHLLNYWYPICFVKDLPKERPLAAQLFGEPLVIFRGASGQLVCLQDRCAHRSTPLSIGSLKHGVIECRYHGWQFGEGGKCVRIPSIPDEKIPNRVAVSSYPATEREDIVWVWPGNSEKCSLGSGFPDIAPEHKAPGWRTSDMAVDQQYSYWALIENLLDPGHLQFTHEGAQGKYLGSTDENIYELHEVVLSDTLKKGGFQGEIHCKTTKKEIRFRLVFDPPVTVRLEVTLPRGWRFFQMHYCIPLSTGKTRILLRSMRTWLKFIPDSLFTKSNLRILNQDKAILYSQRLRTDQGASAWNYPVKADSLAIRFRRWREAIEPRSRPWFKGYTGSSFKKEGIRKGALVESKERDNDIEELPRCYGACDQNLETIEEIWKEAPDLWPSSRFLKKNPGPFDVVRVLGKILSVCAQIFVLAVAILYLYDRTLG